MERPYKIHFKHTCMTAQWTLSISIISVSRTKRESTLFHWYGAKKKLTNSHEMQCNAIIIRIIRLRICDICFIPRERKKNILNFCSNSIACPVNSISTNSRNKDLGSTLCTNELASNALLR